ncbi:hypothetical protein DFJ73DRAFT_657002 [Zopfochytrium polystomum]|nr:hypothetical protein DFJ73DRAFT_657002 [Zopfochytrium polystomum]
MIRLSRPVLTAAAAAAASSSAHTATTTAREAPLLLLPRWRRRLPSSSSAAAAAAAPTRASSTRATSTNTPQTPLSAAAAATVTATTTTTTTAATAATATTPATTTTPTTATIARALPFGPTAAGAEAFRHLQVVRVGEGEFGSSLVTTRAFKKGDVVAPLVGELVAAKRWSTVQVGDNEHIELLPESNLVYMNHSCTPTVALDIPNKRVVAVQDIPAGAQVTFFYPSTEWEMDQPFRCWCGGGSDGGCHVRGARFLTEEERKAHATTFAPHVLRLWEKARTAK